MNLIKWSAPKWAFIAQFVEHCRANAEAMGSNPVEALTFAIACTYILVEPTKILKHNWVLS